MSAVAVTFLSVNFTVGVAASPYGNTTQRCVAFGSAKEANSVGGVQLPHPACLRRGLAALGRGEGVGGGGVCGGEEWY